MASLGKLIAGLLNNINGPLQNLGLDIEMANYSLKDGSKLDNEKAQNISSRLKRMEEEFERIDRLIKASSLKTSQDEDYNNKLMNLNDYLQQE